MDYTLNSENAKVVYSVEQGLKTRRSESVSKRLTQCSTGTRWNRKAFFSTQQRIRATKCMIFFNSVTKETESKP